MTKIIADACSNHLGDRRLMEHMIIEAKNAGVDIIKFQSFNSERLNKDWPDYEKAKAYYKSVELSDDDHVFIIDKCKEVGIEVLFTVFDIERAALLKALGQRSVKIASPDADNDELMNYAMHNFINVYVSNGMISRDKALKLNKFLCFVFYCISRYPTKLSDIDFDEMKLFDGFSDHTADLKAAKKAIDLNIKYIERHYTLGKDLPGKDHKYSSTPGELKELCEYRDYIAKIPLYKTRWR
jgi:N,N'-diacetyllegionaminate synthase